MNIIIPMAGMGKRLRPFTLTTAKPLIKVCGEQIVKILCKTIVQTVDSKIDNIGFVVGNFGSQVEEDLLQVAKDLGAEGKIYHQNVALGTADAIWCAKDLLKGNTIVAFADTLFSADFKINTSCEGIIWTSKVDNPEQFGVVKKNDGGQIISFVEKPKEFVSNEAIIGIYYFKKGEDLFLEIKRLIDNKILSGGEYQLTDCLTHMLSKGCEFRTEIVSKWMDCGNKAAVLDTNSSLLSLDKGFDKIHRSLNSINSRIIEPCYIGDNVKIVNSIIGPYVSIEDNATINNSVVSNSIIGSDSLVENSILDNSMLANNVTYKQKAKNLALGSYSKVE